MVDAAAELFYQRGYASTTVIDISEALNITKGTLYYYVKSKEDLLFAIISETHEMTNANLRRSQQVQGTPRWKRCCNCSPGTHASIRTTCTRPLWVIAELEQLRQPTSARHHPHA